MIKVLLVDDEQMTRDGLKEFIRWDGLGMAVVGEAADGLQALELFAELRPEIVLCDVRMPRMDGIELAAKLRESDPSCKIVFLSGYTDTAYLKSAIKLNAVDYIEKPVQIAELEQLLERIAGEIRAARDAERQAAEMREKLDRGRPELTRRVVKGLLRLSSAHDPAWPELETELKLFHDRFPTKGHYVCCVFMFKETGAPDEWQAEAEKAAESEGLPVLAAAVDNVGVACVAVESERNPESVSLWLNKLTGKGKAKENKPSVAGVGEVCRHLGMFRASYDQALQALQFHFYRGWNTVIRYREIAFLERKSDLLLFDKRHYIRFEEALRGRDLKTAAELLDEAVNELLLYPQPEIESVRKKLFRWYVALTKHYPETMWEFENDELWSSVFVSGELYTIRSFMMRRMEIALEGIENDGRPPERSVIREVVRFVQQNYDKDLSIAAIAAHVYLTPTYLCLLFKKEKGVSINDYITQYRIERAKLLLQDRRLKLYEISRKVGYQDANYFAKVFRKMTGLNPSEYREKICGEIG